MRQHDAGALREDVAVAVSPFSARAFFRDPRAFVARPGNGRGVLRLRAGRRRFALILEPEDIWRVLVTDGAVFHPGKWKRRARRFVGPTLNILHGDEHRERRRLLQPALARPRVEACGPALAGVAQQASLAFGHGERIILREVLDPLSLRMAGRVLMSTELGPAAAPLARDLREIMSALPRAMPPLPGSRSRRALDRTSQAVQARIGERRRSGSAGGDVLGVLLAGGLPDATVRGELIAFLLAAVDEPPSALEAAWYLLHCRPEADARLHDELDRVLGGRAPAVGDRPALPYLDAVVREAMRLFPPARHIDRCPAHDTQLGGERIRAGENVIVSPAVTHAQEFLHDRASEFAPERWLDQAGASRRGAYLPFGAGVHTCIGEPLARSVITLVLAAVAQRWRLVAEPGAAPPGPSQGLVVTLESR